MERPIKIKSINHLINILANSDNVREFFIALDSGSRSWKQMTLSGKTDRYGRRKVDIINEIDDTHQVLSINSLITPKYSEIQSAILCGQFFLYDNNENHDYSDVAFY